MYLEKLPKEDGKFKKVQNIDENQQHTFIDVTMTSDLLCAVEQYSDWLKAFQEYYIQRTGETAEYSLYYNVQIQGMLIPKDTSRINFRVDMGHSAFKFWVRQRDEAARDIVYGFLERLLD